MAGLLTAFLTGAATQANAQITEGKKLQADRDKRREEQADALDLYMKQNTFSSDLQETSAIAKEGRAKETFTQQLSQTTEADIAKHTATSKTDLSNATSLAKLNSGLRANEDAAKDARSNAQTQSILDSIGKITGGLGSTPAASGSNPVADLRAAKAAVELVPGKAGKLAADSLDTKIKAKEKEAEAYNKGVTALGGGDPYKDLDADAKDSLGLEEKLFNPKHYSGPEQTAKAPSSLGNVKQLMAVLMDKTREANPVSGEATSYSRLNATDVKNYGLKLEASLAVLDSPKATPKEKEAAVKTVDAVLKDAKVSRKELLADPRLSTVFTETRKASFNDSLPQKALEAPAAPQASTPSQQDLEFTAKKHGISVAEVKQRLGLK